MNLTFGRMERREIREAAEVKPKRRPGRIASLFRLNKAKYVEMKEEGNKLEF